MIKRRTFHRAASNDWQIVTTDGTVFPYTWESKPEWNFAMQRKHNERTIVVQDTRSDPPTIYRTTSIIDAMNWAVEQVSGYERTKH